LGLVGALVVSDGILTLVWQEPISAFYQRLAQHRLAKDLQALERTQPSPRARRALTDLRYGRQRMAYLARNLESTVTSGSAVGRIEIPRIGARYVLVAGTSVPALKKGPGLYTDTSFPGAQGAVGIAGHRTTYAAPFRRVDELTRGDPITIRMPYGRFVYHVDRTKTVSPSDVSVLRQGSGKLVLTTCTPLFSAAKRLVIFAHLSSSQPLGVAGLTSRVAAEPQKLPVDDPLLMDRGTGKPPSHPATDPVVLG